MSTKIIEQRLKEYAPASQREELNALKEIAQEIALYALSRTDFFKYAAFQGGSCLRVVYGLNRFSEDLDFTALRPLANFGWGRYLDVLRAEFVLYGLTVDVVDRSKVAHAVKTAFIKDSSFGKVLLLRHPRGLHDKQTLQIKLEIDVNPPAGSNFEASYLTYPNIFMITTQDLPSLFAGKCHALLCHPYVKGRDWYDFVWYVGKKIAPNLAYLSEALDQAGPWSGRALNIDARWLVHELLEKVMALDWASARRDAAFFLPDARQAELEVWSSEFFSAMIKRLELYWEPGNTEQ